ncbi:DUF692 domain-containing protein [Motiliproteus coralliicola]|uniref:DUF692 domain-containing protein n=1 Tax=Motiliproteus coralliicola TaxID=2283196 RepID=A0A369WR92_9GAMM|nr:DUF692 domain-containing protein [Motiliproteus coralliicola]RDE24628.1 DUF692 domain-containing protein [Motiliproteus coralliicola]
MQQQLFDRQGVAIGVGLRHPHYQDILAAPAPIDFVEVHSENFFGQGSAARSLLLEVSQQYPVSLHSTAMGLGSEHEIPEPYLDSLGQLVEQISPVLLSDHAAFAWSQWRDSPIHAGDLLPLAYNDNNLEIISRNIDRCQQRLGRRLLVENVSAYITPKNSSMSETEFLAAITHKTDCGLLVDLNNIVVNARNLAVEDVDSYAKSWLDEIPADKVGEIHLAGYSAAPSGEIVIDDHAQPVSEEVWLLYAYALKQFGSVPTLIEWDNQLPDWQVLIAEAQKARALANEVLLHDD